MAGEPQDGERKLGFIRRSLEIWREDASGRAARRTLLRLLPKVSRPLTVLAFGVSIAGLVPRLAALFFFSNVIGAVPAAVEGGRGSPAFHHLVLMLIGMSVTFITVEMLWQLQTLANAPLARRVNRHLQQRVMRAAMTPPGIAHLEDPALLDLVRNAGGVGDGYMTPGGAVTGFTGNLAHRLITIAGGVVVAWFNLPLAIILLTFGIVVRHRLVYDALTKAKVALGQTERLRRADYFRTSALEPLVAKETSVFSLGGWLTERFCHHWLGAMEVLWRERKRQVSSTWIWALPWGGLVALGFFLVGRAGFDGSLTLSQVAMLINALPAACALYLGEFDVQVAYGAAAVPSVLELEQVAAGAMARAGDRPVTCPVASTEIRFEDVSFRYPGTDTDVLSDLDLRVPAGSSLAIVGLNGAGKTTLVKLLARLYEPTEGRITADGVDVREFDPTAWQRSFGAIFQDFVRYELPAWENVGFGSVEHLDDRTAIEDEARRAGASAAIDTLAKGWETVLARGYTDGTDLSGGEWQRVALARALFAVRGGASVLILDEPTANLDVRAEAELFDQFLDLTGGVTTILISHRFASVRRAHSICVLEHGRVVEQGRHDELMARSGRYAALYNLQAARFVDDEVVA